MGNSGSGKTTFARALADKLGYPHLELGGIAHQSDWRMIDPEEFRARVGAFIDTNATWVIEGNYLPVRELVWGHTQRMIWLDPSRFESMRAVVWRTLRRSITREVLWNGNREPWSNLCSLDPEQSVIAWAWAKHPEKRELYTRTIDDPHWKHLSWSRLDSRKAAARWLDEI